MRKLINVNQHQHLQLLNLKSFNHAETALKHANSIESEQSTIYQVNQSYVI